MFAHSVPLFKILGFEIRVDPSWLLIAALIVWSLSAGYFPNALPGRESGTYLVLGVIAMLGLFVSLILHELSHSVVARRFGVGIGGITLFLFGGVAELDEEPESAGSEFWIAVAGPAMSFALAGAAWLVLQAVQALAPGSALDAIIAYLATINLVLAVFNLLPAFPLDGGRVYRAVLWSRLGAVVEATRRASAVGVILANVLMLLGLLSVLTGSGFGGLWMVLIGLFVLMASRSSYSQVVAKVGLRGKTVAELMIENPWTIGPEDTLAELADHVFLAYAVTFAPVVRDGVLIGAIDTGILRSILREAWSRTKVGDVMAPLGETTCVPPDMRARDALKALSGGAGRKLMVVEGQRLRGVLSLRDLMGHIAVMQELGAAR